MLAIYWMRDHCSIYMLSVNFCTKCVLSLETEIPQIRQHSVCLPINVVIWSLGTRTEKDGGFIPAPSGLACVSNASNAADQLESPQAVHTSTIACVSVYLYKYHTVGDTRWYLEFGAFLCFTQTCLFLNCAHLPNARLLGGRKKACLSCCVWKNPHSELEL